MEDHLDSVLEQSCDSDFDIDKGSKERLEGEQSSPTTQQRVKSFLRKNWKSIIILVFLWIAFTLCTTAFSLIAPFFPKEAYDKGASEGIIGFIYGTPPLVVVFLSPLLGYMLPLVGISWYILVGLLLVGTSYVLLGFVTAIPPTWGFILACILLRAVEGAGTALFFTATYSTFPKFFPKSVNLLMGIFQTGMAFGYTFGRPLGGLLYHVGGYRCPFILLGISIILFSLPCSLLIRKLRIEKTDQFLPWRTIFGIITDLYIIVLGLVFVAAQISLSYTGPTLELFLHRQFHFGPVAISWVFFVLASFYSISNFFAGIVSDKLTSVFVSVLGLGTAAAGLFLLGTQDYIHYWKLWISYVSLVLIAIGGPFAVMPIYNKMITTSKGYLISETDSKNALVSFVSGIVSASICFGEYLGPVLGGVLSDFVSFPITSAILGCVTLAECRDTAAKIAIGISAGDME